MYFSGTLMELIFVKFFVGVSVFDFYQMTANKLRILLFHSSKNQEMKKIVFVILIVLVSLNVKATIRQDTGFYNSCYEKEQNSFDIPNRYSDTSNLYHHRYGLWYLPVLSNTVINGVGVGFFAAPFRKQDSLIINGISVEADPLPLVATMMWAMEAIVRSPALLAQKSNSPRDTSSAQTIARIRKKDSIAHIENELFKNMPEKVKINGLSLSIGITEDPTKMNGVAINAVWGMQKDMNGVEISGVFNRHYHFNGIIAGLINSVKTGKGVQIGLYNKCDEGKVIQIGLLNKIGKRITPIMNFNLKTSENL